MPYNPDPAPQAPTMKRVQLPAGCTPRVMFCCAACCEPLLRLYPAAHASVVERVNLSYACDARYDGCQHAEGMKRHV